MPQTLTRKRELQIRWMTWLNEMKQEAGCMDCGYRLYPEALDFDHRPGTVKLFDISSGNWSRRQSVIWAEIAKCDIVCSNCHRHRSKTRLEVEHEPEAYDDSEAKY